MNKICTSLEQSKKLIELGIDAKTADMCWSTANPGIEVLLAFPFIDADNTYDDKIPAWSLSALLELIPPGNVLLRDALSGKYKCINTVDSGYYDNSLDSAFEIVYWLLENKKI